MAEGALHLQQYALIFHTVRWIGPLFVLNAAGCAAAAIALLSRRTVRRPPHGVRASAGPVTCAAGHTALQPSRLTARATMTPVVTSPATP